MRQLVLITLLLVPTWLPARVRIVAPGDTLPADITALEVTARCRGNGWGVQWPGVEISLSLDPPVAADGVFASRPTLSVNGRSYDAPSVEEAARLNTIGIEWRGGHVYIFSGGNVLAPVATVDSLPRPCGVLQFTGRPRIDAIAIETGEAPEPSIVEIPDGASRWCYLDSEAHGDGAAMRLGGDYRFAIVEGAEESTLVYLAGARVNADAWHRGSVKARLLPTGFAGHCRLVWTAADGSDVPGENYALVDEAEGIIELHFPLIKGVVRLAKEM